MAYYVVNVSGYDEYNPTWFKVDNCSKTKFKKIVRECIEIAIDKIMIKTKNCFIGGEEVLDAIIPMLEKIGINRIVPDLEISLKGACYYYRGRWEKPQVFSRNAWKKVLNHNERVEELD